MQRVPQPVASLPSPFCSPRALHRHHTFQEELKELLTEGVTPFLSGFKSRAGKPFEARLAINQDSKVVMMFPFTVRRSPGGASGGGHGRGGLSRRLPGITESSETDE
jgi:hypothetical protein